MNGTQLQKVKGVNGKPICGMWVRPPATKAHTKYPSTLAAVHDSKRQPVRGLWYQLPTGPFIAQVTTSTSSTKLRLKATTLAQARDELQRLRIQSRDGNLIHLGKSPGFTQFADEYMQSVAQEGKKCPSTIYAESCRIRWWQHHLAETPINKITLPLVRQGIAQLRNDTSSSKPLSDRSLNYYVTAMNNVLNRALELHLIQSHPIPPKTLWRKLKRSERPLIRLEEFERLCQAAQAHCPRNGKQFADLVWLLCYCGTKISSALRLRWSDVDWDNQQLVIARDGVSKGKRVTRVDFNADLENHLRDMYARRKDSSWVFPSGQRGNENLPATTFRETLAKAREHAGLGQDRVKLGLKAVGFHDCRHFFCSFCVMNGVDFKTIAEWVGHIDGGILASQVYGHLSPEHKRSAAQKLTFTTNIIDVRREAI